MRIDRIKKYMGLIILLFMTGCSMGVSTEPESNPQERWSLEMDFSPFARIESLSIPQEEWCLKEENNLTVELCSEDDDFYVQCLQNLNQGNSITYADGYYYFRSQTENYSLCRTKGAGMSVEVVADQVPGAIYIREDWVYFINVSDSRTLYCVRTDGSELKKLSDFPMQELVVLEDKIYFRSVYDREYDPFYQLTEDAAEDDRYLYSMNLDGSGCELLLPKLCMEFVTDGKYLYYLTAEKGKGLTLYKSSLDGKNKEKILHKEDRIWDILPYQGNLYWVDAEQKQLIRLNVQGEEEILASDVWRFAIARGQAYVMNEEKIRKIELTTGKESLLVEREKALGDDGQSREDNYSWYNGSYNRGIFLVNGQVFARYFESEEKGVLWHILDGETFVVFEDMEPLTAEELVLDASFLHEESNFYYPGRTDENAEQYLDANGELHYEESFGTTERGSTYGDYSIMLPKFNSKLTCYKRLNQQMEELLEIAVEDKDSFFQEISEVGPEQCHLWWRECGYSHLYIGKNYISMYHSIGGYEGGVREWRRSLPIIFDRQTGRMLAMDDLFTVEKSIYMKRLTGAIYKYCEMTGWDDWNDAFDNNVLVKNLSDLRCYLTPDGIVLCYERYEIYPGCNGSPAFEIPYEWFANIFSD